MRNGYVKRGYTLLEILVATTLALMLMYGVAAVFSQIGSLMSQTQNIMGMSNSLRSTRDRLATDLTLLTVPRLTPPISQYGFFCYSEGLGADDARVLAAGTPFAPNAVAQDIENGGYDTTVGDTDDILSFTAKAPVGEWFRGRFEVVNKVDVNNKNSWTTTSQIIESEYAEIVWFVRGTTLYRRVLLIVPDEVLQDSLTGKLNSIASTLPDIRQGYGFYQFYDVSVHLDNDGNLVANTLADLSNRKNRFGVWSSPVLDPADDGTVSWSASPFDTRQGFNRAWYWLRMPTLQESATAPTDVATTEESDLATPTNVALAQNPNRYFRAGVPFGMDDSTMNTAGKSRWFGNLVALSNSSSNSTDLPVINASTPPVATPFIDYWNEPNLWAQQDLDSGDLNFALYPNRLAPTATVSGEAANLYSQDVLLTNVLSFDVKVWDDAVNAYVDLGNYGTALGNTITNYQLDDMELSANANTFTSFGRYRFNNVNLTAFGTQNNSTNLAATDSLATNVLNYPFLPAVYDTWTEEYEKEHLLKTYSVGTNTFTNVTRRRGFTAAEIPTDGTVTSAVLPDYPPPYDKELTGLQVEIRVFDPVSRSIKNVTLNADMKNR